MSLTSPDALLFTGLAIAATWLYVSRSRQQASLCSRLLTAAVILHTLYVLCRLVLYRPPNLFSRLGIPINAPVERIKSQLLIEAGFDTTSQSSLGAVVVPLEIPKDVELLLTRLNIIDSRNLFVRCTCQYCSSAGDYALFTLSGVMLEYLRSATLLLMLTIVINGRERLRTNILGALTCALLAEGYAFTSASAVPLAKDAQTAFMWHDNLFLARHVLFLVLPVLTQTLPAIYAPGPPSMALAPALAILERTIARAHLLKYTRQAIMRRPETRELAGQYWAKEAAEGEAGRGDPAVQKTAEKLGFGFTKNEETGTEGKLGESVKMAVESLRPLFAPPPS
ncbi:hypothetical protein HYDPIDRAFT_93251 [Hydnomerulius pinastri MD-312]|uniref:Uncharacterized protein n=1 Tax=Hydnomerulius pinastri MD-312 TaxID=994086 RepID=A0A0C9W798_9AGAM|nr:hypothetical protein HYDPIDRAFT_93251 [Hydnomerulius pinastri MD-312]